MLHEHTLVIIGEKSEPLSSHENESSRYIFIYIIYIVTHLNFIVLSVQFNDIQKKIKKIYIYIYVYVRQ